MSAYIKGKWTGLTKDDLKLIDTIPEKFQFAGYMRIDSDDPLPYQAAERAYVKGMAPFTLGISEFFDTGCERTVYARGQIIVDDPVDVYIMEYKDNGKYASASEKLTLQVGNFYKNDRAAPILQVSIDNRKEWIDMQRSVSPNEVISLSYDEIVGELQKKLNIGFEDLFGKNLCFRVVKTLLNNTRTYGKDTDGISFYPDGMKFNITSTKRTWCDEDVKLIVHLENPADAKCMTLDTNRFHWVMKRQIGDNTFNCYMKPVGGNEFHIRPILSLNDVSWETLFQEKKDVTWDLQLQDTKNENSFATKKPFTIPAKPKEITIQQMAPGYTINGVKYHVPYKNSYFAMLNITDPSYESHHRVPYMVILEDGTEIPVPALGEIGRAHV
jgi:hypothetical protein